MSGILHAPFLAAGGSFRAEYPQQDFTLSFLNNSLDFKYVPFLDEGSDVAAINFSTNNLGSFLPDVSHLVSVFDATGGQGEGGPNPHCGPIMRNGANMWALARGGIFIRDSGVAPNGNSNFENWNGTSSPGLTDMGISTSSMFRAGVVYFQSWADYGVGLIGVEASYLSSGRAVALINGVKAIDAGSPFHRAARPAGAKAAIGAIESGFSPPSPGNGCTEPSRAGVNTSVAVSVTRASSYNRVNRPARYYRVNAVMSNPFTLWGNEIELLESPGGPNILTPSSPAWQANGSLNSAAVDGVAGVIAWGGFGSSQLTVDAGRTRSISNMRIYWGSSSDPASLAGILIRSSDDGIWFDSVKWIPSPAFGVGWLDINLN